MREREGGKEREGKGVMKMRRNDEEE